MLTLRPAPGGSRAGPRSAPSALAAALLTAAMLALVLLTSGRLPSAWWRHDATPPTTERVTYVAPPPVAPVAPPRAVPPPVPAPRAAAPAGPAPTAAPSVRAPGAPTFGAPVIPIGPVTADTGAGGAAGGRRTPGATSPGDAPLLPLPHAVGAARPESPPLTGTQQDSALRAVMGRIFSPAAVAAAIQSAKDAKARANDEAQRESGRAAGGGAPRLHPAVGVSIPVFGGMSAAERRRNDSVDADVRARLARIAERARLDSIAARRRDSLKAIIP